MKQTYLVRVEAPHGLDAQAQYSWIADTHMRTLESGQSSIHPIADVV
jgi:hypothetical protein